jgi:hypothetical protein
VQQLHSQQPQQPAPHALQQQRLAAIRENHTFIHPWHTYTLALADAHDFIFDPESIIKKLLR